MALSISKKVENVKSIILLSCLGDIFLIQFGFGFFVCFIYFLPSRNFTFRVWLVKSFHLFPFHLSLILNLEIPPYFNLINVCYNSSSFICDLCKTFNTSIPVEFM